MSTISAAIADVDAKLTALDTKVDTLVASNATLTADAVAKDQLIANLQTELSAAQAAATDPADATAIAAIQQRLADELAKLP